MTSDAANDLFQAIHANNVEGVRSLITAEPGLLTAVSPTGLSPVLFATYYRRPQITRLLVGAGAPLSVFEAAATGELAALRAYLDAQPDLVNTLSPDGFTPLGLAAFFGREEVAADLLARGADVNRASTNPMRVQPLHSAVAGNHTALALRLLAAGADVKAVQHGGFTPLMSAAQNGNAALVEALLAAGTHPAATTEDGRDAAALAQEEGHTAVLEILSAARHDPQETRNAPPALRRETGRMTDPLRDGKPDRAPADGEQVNELTGQPDYKTGYQMPDPKDDHQGRYTTTPPEDRVGSSDQSEYQPVQAQDPKEVTGPFDQLATRDPVAMEHAPQKAEFAGAQTVAGIGIDSDTPVGLVGPMAGIGVTASMATAREFQREAVDPNPGYTPPGKEVTPHVREQPGDLLPGTPPEIKAEVAGTVDDDDTL